jgi:DNA polymerase
LVKPRLILALGATAGLALLGRKPAILAERGGVIDAPDGTRVLLTVHPSNVFRLSDPMERHAARAILIEDLRAARIEAAMA